MLSHSPIIGLVLTLGLVFGPVLCHVLGPEYSRAHRMLESMVLTAGVDDVADRVGGVRYQVIPFLTISMFSSHPLFLLLRISYSIK